MSIRHAVVALAILVGTAASGPAQTRFALLVGVNEYDHDDLRPLRFAENDATVLGELLKADGYEVVLLTGAAGQADAARKPTQANVLKSLDALLDQFRKGDTILVGLAGHGVQFEGQPDSYFCPTDAKPFATQTGTLVSLSEVYRKLNETFAGTKVLMVDACRNDPNPNRGRGIDADTAPRPPKGVAALFSCSAGQRAYEHEDLKHGVFFFHVLEALRGKAGTLETGEVTWGRLIEYVPGAVEGHVAKLFGEGVAQSPNTKADIAGRVPVLVTRKLAKGDALDGAWRVLSMNEGGREQPVTVDKPVHLFFMYGYVAFAEGREVTRGMGCRLDSTADPNRIDLTAFTGERTLGIYKLDRDQLTLRMGRSGSDVRPTSFADPVGARMVAMVLRRDPDAKLPDPMGILDKLTRKHSATALKAIGATMKINLLSRGTFPPEAIADDTGKRPLLSWRVAILPFIDQEELYKQFRLDEPWDSDHNKKLIPMMPEVYGTGDKTHYRVFTGPDAAFHGPRGLPIGEFKDGMSNTILVVEAPDAVVWTKPDELIYDRKKPVPALGGKPFADGFHVVFADGTVRFVKTPLAEKTLRAMITRNGQDTFELPPE